jgi:Dyp-type peroxidase family
MRPQVGESDEIPLPEGVFPNAVIRDARSTGLFIFGQLDPNLTTPGVQSWLQEITGYLNTLREPDSGGTMRFDAAFGFGPSFFLSAGTPRFGLTDKSPAGFTNPTVLPASLPFPADFLLYAMSVEEERLVQLVQWLAACRPTPVIQMRVERGFQRANKRESFRFLDGQRNPGIGDRSSVARVGPDQMGNEPAWVEGAAYLAYMKIRQDLAHATALGNDVMEQAIGRRDDDGSRLDQQPGMDPKNEPDFTDPNNPKDNSHVRKVGPRGDEQGATIAIFRRGLPYMDIAADGTPEFGLHFVSFGDPDQFNTILNRWMVNPLFPAPNTGPDALMVQQLISFELGAMFIVPPADRRYIGAQIFDPESAPLPATAGRVVVKKRVADAGGNPLPQHTLRGAVFQVLQNGNPVGATFTTDAAGHAISGDLPTGSQYVLHEVTPLPGANQAADVPFTLSNRRQVIEVINTFGQPPHTYGS